MKRISSAQVEGKKILILLNNTEDNVIKNFFDCQQNQSLPKLNVGEVFYSRQAWLYNLCIMQHKPNTKQTKDDIEFHVWLENQSGRGANEIASALQHYLKKIQLKCLRAKQKDLKIELYSDSCSIVKLVENLLKFCDISDDPDAQIFYEDVLQSSGTEDDSVQRTYDEEELEI